MQGVSSNDLETLERIFSPEEGFAVIEKTQSETFHDKIDTKLLESAKKDEREAISCEEKDTLRALEILSRVIESCPTYASAYNNRGQVRILLISRKELAGSIDSRGDVNKVMVDLELAIKYGVGLPTVLGNAHTQRAILKKKHGDLPGSELDFQEGARNGNAYAKSQVKENPYAKMCNAMMKKAMDELI